MGELLVFQSYEYIKHIGYDTKTKQHSYQYKIIDSDFEEVGVVVEVEVEDGVEVSVAVIDTYEKRNLNVAKNLMLAILWHHKKYPYVSVADIVRYNKQCNPKFAPYKEDVAKYMILL
jgi:hypothetical protein